MCMGKLSQIVIYWQTQEIFLLDSTVLYSHISCKCIIVYTYLKAYNSRIIRKPSIQLPMKNTTEGVSTHCVVGQVNPCHRGRYVIGGVPSCFRRVSNVLIATASKGGGM